MNLASANERGLTQLDKMRGRASIVPQDRNTRAPALEINASMATARRGDGGAEQLMRTLGVVAKAGNEFTDYLQADHAQREQTAMEQGALDALAGRVDPEKERKSEGYRNALTKGRTATKFMEEQARLDTRLADVIERQDSPDLAVRQAEVRTILETAYRDFATDPETGQLRDFVRTPGALRYLSEEIARHRPQIEAAAMQRIGERFNEESVTNLGAATLGQMKLTKTVDLPTLLSLVPDTVPETVRNTALVRAVSQGARELWEQDKSIEGLKTLDAILGKPSALPPVAPADPAGVAAAVPVVQVGDGQATAPASKGRVSFDTLASAVMWQESRGNARAVSPKGAVGTMQTMPTTLRDPGFGVRPAKDNSPAELERVGRDYLRAMLKRYGGDHVLALAAYNAGPGKADEWRDALKGKTEARIAAIPFKETREYVRNIMGRLGMSQGASGGAVAPDDPIQATPYFRLTAPGADPATAYEQSGAVPALLGVSALKLTTQDRAYLQEQRDMLAARIKDEWRAKRDEEWTNNEAELMWRLYGQGEPLTQAEITEAALGGKIDPRAGLRLFDHMRRNADAAQSYADRREAMVDRDTQRRRDDEIEGRAGRYLSAMATGRMSGAAARAEVLRELPTIRDPLVQRGLANAVLGTANDIENLRVNSAPLRDSVKGIEEARDNWLASLRHAYPYASRYSAVAAQANDLFDRAQAELLDHVRNGGDPATIKGRLGSKYRPRLQALMPRPAPPAK